MGGSDHNNSGTCMECIGLMEVRAFYTTGVKVTVTWNESFHTNTRISHKVNVFQYFMLLNVLM